MFVSLVVLVVITQCFSQVQPINTRCFSIYSEDNRDLESLTWAVGVPNITVVIASSGEHSIFHFSQLFNLKKTGISTIFAAVRLYDTVHNHNATLVNISSYFVSGRSFNFTVIFLRPDLIDGHNISVNSGCCCDSETLSPIQLKYCPKPDNNVQFTALPNTKFRYNDVIFVLCKNSVFVDKSTEVVSGRTADLKCGENAEWIGPKCWDGLFLDLTKGNAVQTFTKGVKVLMYCDVINQTMTSVAIRGSDAVYSNGTKMAWAYVYFSNADNNRNVTCYQRSAKSQQSYQRSVKLNILYPPILDGLYQRSITLHKDVHVEIGFESNPPVSGLNAVTVTKHGKNVENIYKKYEDNLNKVVIHFINASLSDLGEYSVIINSGHPFNTSQHFLVRVSARIPQVPSTLLYSSTSAVPLRQANTSVPLSSLLIVSILFVISLVVLIIGAIKYFRVVRSKGKPKFDEPSVHFNKNLPGKVENVGNYEVPIAGNPYLPNPSQRPRPQGSNYQNMTSAGSSQQEESTYDCI